MKTMVIDGSNILMRAVKAGTWLDGGGVNTGPLYFFINSLSKHIREEQPTHVVVCWDGGRSRYRTEIYPDYKGARREGSDPEDDRDTHFSLAREFVSLSGVAQITMQGVEADDLIAAFWRQGVRPFVIVSGDKDFFQLLDDEVTQIRPGGKEEHLDTAAVIEKMGCHPEQIPLVMALTGDSGDGVPGVRGFGTKTAVKKLGLHEWDLDSLIETEPQKFEGVDPWLFHRLVDLREERFPIPVPPIERFSMRYALDSGIAKEALLAFLDNYLLQSVRVRVEGGTLWKDPRDG